MRPDDPGGLDVAGDSGTAYATGAGEDSDAQLDVSKLARGAAAGGRGARSGCAEAGAVRAEPRRAGAGAGTPGAKGTVIQLGAYGSTAKAETRVADAVGAFPGSGGPDQARRAVQRRLSPARLGRLAAEAQAACRAVIAGGENCFVAQ